MVNSSLNATSVENLDMKLMNVQKSVKAVAEEFEETPYPFITEMTYTLYKL